MKRIIFISFIIFMFGLISLHAQDADQILAKVDSVVNAPQDQKAKMEMILIDEDGNKKHRKAVYYQKGDEKRLIRFTSPPNQKGVAFLGLQNDIRYLYMPAFHKIRRIASHVKNSKFAGTDFTYNDLSSFGYSENYNPTLIKEDDQFYILKLTPKPESDREYGKLKIQVRKDIFYPVKIQFFDKAGNLWKVLERRKVTQIKDYWISQEMEMKDLKEEHSTIMLLKNINLDTDLSERIFSKRFLRRAR